MRVEVGESVWTGIDVELDIVGRVKNNEAKEVARVNSEAVSQNKDTSLCSKRDKEKYDNL